MKKIWILSAVTTAFLMAQGDSLESLLESKKINSTTEKSFEDLFQVSLIVDGSYTTRQFDNEDEIEHLEIPGLVHGGHGEEHEGHVHAPLDGNEGFTFNYAELHFGTQTDLMDFSGNFHITKDMFEVEELFGVTRGLPYSLSLKVGKFRSDFGYLNNKHEHSYNFFEIPLIYNALLGYHALLEEGAQLQYVLSTPYYMMVGFEAFRGENEQSFGYEGFMEGMSDVDYPSLYVSYLKTSIDIGGGTLLAGVSYAKGHTRLDHLEDEEEPHAFAGDTKLYGTDLVYKYYFAAEKAISFQGEYLYRKMDGIKYGEGALAEGDMRKKQAGFYGEFIYQHDKNWRTGVRYSGITQNDIFLNDIKSLQPDDMYITSMMLEYNFSEKSRLRLQYNYNSALYTDEGEKNNKKEFILQYTHAFGAHGAHAF
ncbi:hypothetical protein [Sulfurovum mangrovi]|uniref:hypothetical protein n=1 Tax=Sulfurovum mangrovi TaxID=2893889 RepID=UPI001E395BD2|nr:hypothetical protein [Sulfurovum mangrovi]UFH59747.1 hypothetical protein LN246_02565 [Sulfurovum mangrovi]UFH60548.1 hypothetical protein LN246_13130 [Sulfurovum mangrovi]